jgi:hypothetical protein
MGGTTCVAESAYRRVISTAVLGIIGTHDLQWEVEISDLESDVINTPLL